MSRNKIYEHDTYYDILKPYVDWCTKTSYSRVEVRGKENIPTDGAVILSPNHCNTLMDALVILRSFNDETVFGARADIFNKPLFAKIMFFLRILPMVRQRDGLRNVLKNYETQETIIETLENGVRFCIFPEGRHRPAHSLLPLGKGIFRLAWESHKRFGDKKPVYIVPTGIEYGDHFRYRTTCLVTFGEPINISEFITNNPDLNEAQIMDPLKKLLSEKMSLQKTSIKDGEDFESKWALTRILACEDGKKGNLTDRMQHNKAVIEVIEEACEKNPEAMKALLDDALKFDKNRKRFRSSIWSFRSGNNAAGILGKALIALLGLPYFIFASVTSFPMWMTFEVLKSKIKDKAFRNTAGAMVKLAFGPVTFLIWSIIAFCIAWWPVALAFSLLTVPSYAFFYDFREFLRVFVSDIRTMGNKGLKAEFKDIRERFERI